MSLDLPEGDFWRQTPRQVAAKFKAKSIQFRREYNDRVSIAYLTAALPRYKRFPELRKLLARDQTVQRKQTSEQQWAIFAAMAEASKVLRKN